MEPKCLSRCLMDHLLKYSEPRLAYQDSRGCFVNIGLAILGTTALLEFVALTFFAIVPIALQIIDDRPLEFFNNLAINCLQTKTLGFHEAVDGAKMRRHTREGAFFLKIEVLGNITKREQSEISERFESCEPKIIPFILSKAFFESAKKEDAIPRFFKKSTRKAIALWRHHFKQNPTHREHLTKITSSFYLFDQTLSNPYSLQHNLVVSLQTAASDELQQSLLITRCWEEAISQLQEEREHSEIFLAERSDYLVYVI